MILSPPSPNDGNEVMVIMQLARETQMLLRLYSTWETGLDTQSISCSIYWFLSWSVLILGWGWGSLIFWQLAFLLAKISVSSIHGEV